MSESVGTGTGVGVEASVDPTVGEIVEGGCEAALDSGAGLVHAATATAMAAASAQADERQGRTTSLRRPPRGPVTPTGWLPRAWTLDAANVDPHSNDDTPVQFFAAYGWSNCPTISNH